MLYIFFPRFAKDKHLLLFVFCCYNVNAYPFMIDKEKEEINRMGR